MNNGANFKIAFLLFIIYLLLNSSIFIDKILSKVKGSTTPLQTPTTKGTILIGIIISLSYIVLDMLASNEAL